MAHCRNLSDIHGYGLFEYKSQVSSTSFSISTARCIVQYWGWGGAASHTSPSVSEPQDQRCAPSRSSAMSQCVLGIVGAGTAQCGRDQFPQSLQPRELRGPYPLPCPSSASSHLANEDTEAERGKAGVETQRCPKCILILKSEAQTQSHFSREPSFSHTF